MPLIPETISFIEFVFLVGFSLCTSMLTAAVGIGGGSLMLAVLAQILPVKAIIPVHGIVQLGSNLGRATLMRADIDFSLLRPFLLGSLLGALVGGKLVINLPVELLRLILGLFLLYAAWGPNFKGFLLTKAGFALCGLFTTILTMFVGATGSLVIAQLKSFALTPVQLIATSAGCISIKQLLKIVVFGALGFAFSEYLLLSLCMVGFGFIGTILGNKILLKTKPKNFDLIFNSILTILALRLLWQASVELI